MVDGELGRPPVRVTAGGGLELGRGRFRRGAGRRATRRAGRAPRAPARRPAGGTSRVLDPAQLQHVVRPTGLGPRSDHRALPATEGLAADDGACDVAVDVGVAHLDLVRPPGAVGRVERPDAAGQPEGEGVLHADSASSRSRTASKPSTGPKHSVRANQSSGPHAVEDAGRPQVRRARDGARFEQPALVRFGGGQAPGAASRSAARPADPWWSPASVAGPSWRERTASTSWCSEALGRGDVADQDGQRRGRAFLPGVPEGGAGQVGGGQVEVGLGHDHECVLPRRLGHERRARGEAGEELRGLEGSR